MQSSLSGCLVVWYYSYVFMWMFCCVIVWVNRFYSMRAWFFGNVWLWLSQSRNSTHVAWFPKPTTYYPSRQTDWYIDGDVMIVWLFCYLCVLWGCVLCILVAIWWCGSMIGDDVFLLCWFLVLWFLMMEFFDCVTFWLRGFWDALYFAAFWLCYYGVCSNKMAHVTFKKYLGSASIAREFKNNVLRASMCGTRFWLCIVFLNL